MTSKVKADFFIYRIVHLFSLTRWSCAHPHSSPPCDPAFYQSCPVPTPHRHHPVCGVGFSPLSRGRKWGAEWSFGQASGERCRRRMEPRHRAELPGGTGHLPALRPTQDHPLRWGQDVRYASPAPPFPCLPLGLRSFLLLLLISGLCTGVRQSIWRTNWRHSWAQTGLSGCQSLTVSWIFIKPDPTHPLLPTVC